ncbi:MAG: fibronectin type III domain-containing protein, partial [Candidatus Cryptobacteroides sp.]
TFTYDSDYLKHVGTSRYIGVYNDQDWRCYTSTTGNIASQTFGFFVEQSGSSEGGSDPVKLDAPFVSCTAQTENSLTFTWEAVANASGYQVSLDGGTSYEATQTETSYTWSGLSAETSYTLYVKAVGDGSSYTDSNAAYAEGTTTASSGGEGGETKAWKLVTDASTLAFGDQLIIVSTSKGFAAGAISSAVMGNVTVTITDNVISSLPSDVVVLTLGGSTGAWTLANSDGQLLGATAAKKLAWDSGTTTWSISIESNSATIQNGTSTYGRFLYNVNSPRFTTYTSATSTSMLLPEIYRYE